MIVDYIALQLVIGYGARNAKKVLENFTSLSDFTSRDVEDLQKLGLTKEQAKILKSDSLKTRALQYEKMCKENYIEAIPYNSEKYPKNLSNIFSPPVLLYVVGKMPDFDKKVSVSIVGPRKISEYGRMSAFSLSARLSLAGAIVVSGGALGGDTAAHLGAVSVSKPTVAVLGGGVISKYLKQNAELRRKIVNDGGALISEFLPDFEPHGKYTFSIRNRIISGISNALAVVEAPIKSGTIITANHAIEQGKDVFSMPGRPNSEECEGTNKLISDGAHILTSPKDILALYGKKVSLIDMEELSKEQLFALYKKAFSIIEKPKVKEKKGILKAVKKEKVLKKPQETNKKETEEVIPELEEELLKIYNAVPKSGITADELSEMLGEEISSLLSNLMILELKGLVSSTVGNTYKKIQ